jgi:SAM-dependent methyltransferase
MNNAKDLIKPFVPEILKDHFREYRIQKESEFFKGNKVFCPICGSMFREFAPAGLVKRFNARCPVCSSFERHRLIWKYVSDKTNLFSPERKKLLHFAPERMFYDAFSKINSIEYFPADLYPKKYRYKDKKVIKEDITEISFQTDTFDVVLCCHVLEHIAEDRLALSELYRVMKKGGWGIFHVPIDSYRKTTYEDFSITKPREREKAFGQHDHFRKYGSDYKEKLLSVGFKVTVDDYIKNFSSEELFKYGLMKNELIYFCEK